MADGNTSPAQRGRGLLALNITDGQRFLVGGGIKESRAVTVCGFKWKFETRVSPYGRGRNKASISTLISRISCTVVDPQKPIHVKAKCRLRVRHAIDDGLDEACTNTLSFDPAVNDADKELEFIENSVKGAILADTEGYLVDDTLRIECLIDAQVTGTESAEETSRKRQYEDVTLVVGGNRIYANKGILATHCEYFEGAFFGDFVDRNKEEHELPDVDPDEFEKFKAVIYPSQKALDGENIYAVVNLADRFGAKSLLDKCEEFMLEHLNAAEAFKGLSAYAGLDDLKSKFLAAMSDKELDSWTTPEGLRSLDKGNTDLVLLEYKNRRA